jgi:ABC-type transport system substrate-binding protein
VLDQKTRVQAAMLGWFGGTGGPPSYLLPYLTCGATQYQNWGHFCNRRIDAHVRRALRIEATDPPAAIPLWARIERELVDQAP